MKNAIRHANFRAELLIIAILLQLLFNLLLVAGYFYGDFLQFGFNIAVIVLFSFVLAILAIYLFYNIIFYLRKEHELITFKREQEHNENLSTFLRELKHDLNNQIFVVNGFMQLGKVEEASTYAEELSEQFDWMEALLKLNQPEFASLVLNKMMDAKNQGIEIEVNIATDDISKISRDVLNRSVGNLLDNAVEAMNNIAIEPKQLIIEIYPKKDYLLVSVENTGEVPPEIAENMFQRGFSTKEDNEEHGLGLHIVKTLMESIGGKITHENKEGTTIFQLFFPVKPA